MIIVFLILSFLRTLRGAPTPVTSSLDLYTLAIRDGSAGGCNTTSSRTLYDLVSSCFATVVACVWKSVHPNIPGPRDSGWTRMKRQLTTTFCILVAPEMMVWWALAQYAAAKSIVTAYNNIEVVKNANPEGNTNNLSLLGAAKEWFSPELPLERAKRRIGQKWTLTHGFFLQMGGFLLYENDKPTEVLSYERMEELIKQGEIDAPIYTESDLQDRSKGDTTSKALAALQTTWFAAQCLTRVGSHLPLSELEVVVLAFALLNWILYVIWWEKPQGVMAAIFIPRKVKCGPRPAADISAETTWAEDRYEAASESLQKTATTSALGLQDDSRMNVDIMVSGPFSAEDIPSPAAEDAYDISDTSSEPMDAEGRDAAGDFSDSDLKKSWLRRQLGDLVQGSWVNFLMLTVFVPLIPIVCVVSLFRPIGKLGNLFPYRDTNRRRVPIFHVNNPDKDDIGGGRRSIYTAVGTGILFGLVHMFGWWSESLSPTQRLLWRISTIIITVAPGVLLLLSAIFIARKPFDTIFFLAGLLIMTAYPIARAILIALAFVTLHKQPPEVFESVSWTSFIPHV